LPVYKHSSSPISPARLIFVAAVTILVALVVWVAVRAVGPSSDGAAAPTVVQPSTATVPVGAAEPVAASPTIPLLPPSSPSSAPTPSVTPSRSHSASPSAAGRHSASASPSPHATHTQAKPVAKATFSAVVASSSSWGGGYVAMVRVTNTGTKAAGWSVSVGHGAVPGLRLNGTWNAQGSQQGTTFTFAGGSLAPGKSASFGYQAGARTRDQVKPSGCSASSGSCRVS
jgi:hypothetical protein